MNHRDHTPTPPPALRRFLDEYDPPTPCLVVDTDTVVARYRALSAAFPQARIQYAVKANPSREVVRALAEAGARFDVASPAEIDLCLDAGSDGSRLSYGNTVKKPAAIAHAHSAGITEYACEASGDLHAIAAHAPGAQVSVRLLVDPPDSATPFGRKFGCSPAIATDLLVEAAGLGLDPVGVSLHVGSQQQDPDAWDGAIATAASVFTAAAERDVPLRRLNIGGGFATSYRQAAPDPAEYATAIAGALRTRFPADEPELVLEPGRAVVADAGLIRAEVVLVSRKAPGDDHRWVYLDVGRYNGLAETENEAITYPVELVDDRDGPDGPVVLAGPTCDGDDVLYQRTPYRLPESLRAGDRIDILAAGAYTASYSSVAFNGIPPLRTYCIREGRPTGAD
ncbi:type III PLP-dependent enzyme [Prauserella halophila]|uniref:ornithine decarboxylase n=1 Tax=Prauserella halophila TaxID=185641 RepID=A0ABP4GGW0_9PSEU|nr:type III PLP-dependent enzyme [Prauserella halophila]MCP2234343.1 ornithine decarboxylase [Prauserella halophila]